MKVDSKQIKSIKAPSKANEKTKKIHKYNKKLTILIIFLLGVFLIFSSYAWFSTNLNVRVRTFKVSIKKTGGLFISLDGINFDTEVELNADVLINQLKDTYPNNLSQWASNGMVPVSSNGISDPNSYFFDIYYSPGGVLYTAKDKTNGFIHTVKAEEKERKAFSRYIAFDLFFKNVTGSPIADNLYFADGTVVKMAESQNFETPEAEEEMTGLLNSVRLGIVKVGTTSLNASSSEIQNLSCNNSCQSIIYEPYARNHTALSIERASKYGVVLRDGEKYPTYGNVKEGRFIYVKNTVSGSPDLDKYYFNLQGTMTEEDITEPLFTVPDGITKARVYLWLEGQDIDSLETDSAGSELELSLGFFKDTLGYTSFDN